jgi:poly-gamma-glutamate synthesis protein (capsule biosynthesis protein)
LKDKRYRNLPVILAISTVLLWSGLMAFWLPSDQDAKTVSVEQEIPWHYIRDDVPSASHQNEVSLLAFGDIMLGRNVSQVDAPFHLLTGVIRSADFAIGNLEFAITEKSSSEESSEESSGDSQAFRLTAPISSAAQLAEAGFDILSVANNHTLDAGMEGFSTTLSSLQSQEIQPIGISTKNTPQILFLEKNQVKLAFLAFNTVSTPASNGINNTIRPASWDQEIACEAVRQAKAQADAVIVSIHWGYEYQNQSDAQQKYIARTLAQAGADLILGHHPHVIQETQILSLASDKSQLTEHYIAYSLGNFVFDQQFGETSTGLALQAVFDNDGLKAVKLIPIHSGPQPDLLPVSDTQILIHNLSPEPPIITFACQDDFCEQDFSNPARMPDQRPIFNQGLADLNGNGIPEKIELIDETLIIQENGRIVWHSPQEWIVEDAEIGDPNQDGRQEIMVVFRKPDPFGILRSHPFLISNRGGRYETVWGGSAVSDPIREIAFSDLNRDGSVELIVIENVSGTGFQRIATWQWHGWGFSQTWRSPMGNFSDLLVDEQIIWAQVNHVRLAEN